MECYPLPVADDKDDEEPEEHGDDNGTNGHDQFHVHLFFCTCGIKSQTKTFQKKIEPKQPTGK